MTCTQLHFAAELNPVTGRIAHRPLPRGWVARSTSAACPDYHEQPSDAATDPKAQLFVTALYPGKKPIPADALEGSGYLPGKVRQHIHVG